jgi:four helix bundle protein
MSYRKLEVWLLAKRLTSEIHEITLNMLPKHEMYEEGSQIRRSIKSVRANIVEGYGRRRYKHDFIRFLTYAQASCDETMDHLHILQETGSLTDEDVFESAQEHLDELGRKLNKFIQSVERAHHSVRESDSPYGQNRRDDRESSIENRVSSIENQESSIENRASSIENRVSSIENRVPGIENPDE